MCGLGFLNIFYLKNIMPAYRKNPLDIGIQALKLRGEAALLYRKVDVACSALKIPLHLKNAIAHQQ